MKRNENNFFDALFEKLSQDYVSSECKRLTKLRNSLPKTEFSKQYEQKMDKLMRRMKLKKRLRSLSANIAIVVLVCFVVTLANPKSAGAIKSHFVNIIKTSTDRYVSTTSFNSNVEYDMSQFPDSLEYVYIPTKLPSGYDVGKIEYFEGMYYRITYKKQEADLIFEVWTADTTDVMMDNDQEAISDVKLQWGVGTFLEKEKRSYLNWSYDKYSFILIGEGLDKDSFVEIANDIALVNLK